jgi:uroporphyrinogen-III decarboxylase
MLAFGTGKGGGFILANGCGIYDAKPENMRAMVGTVRKHGWH